MSTTAIEPAADANRRPTEALDQDGAAARLFRPEVLVHLYGTPREARIDARLPSAAMLLAAYAISVLSLGAFALAIDARRATPPVDAAAAPAKAARP